MEWKERIEKERNENMNNYYIIIIIINYGILIIPAVLRISISPSTALL